MTVAVADPTTTYAESVVSGERIAGPHVRDACARHLRDLETGEDRGLVWDVDAADYGLAFFPSILRLSGGQYEDKPFVLFPWEAFIVGSLFGWRTWSEKHEAWVRRFRVAYVETAKGSGKSPLAAGIGIEMMVADDEPRAEVYAAATKKDQAMILFRDAVAMVDLSPELGARLKKTGGSQPWNLSHPPSGSFFRCIASDDSQSGPRPHCALLDEIHEHKGPLMVEMMRAGQKWRRQPLIFMITNSGFDRTSVCYSYHLYASKVAAGTIEDDQFFGFVCSIDDGEDPFTDEPDPDLGYPRSWARTNPSLEHGLPGVDYLEGQVREAQGMPAKASIVRRLNFCEWVDAENPWIEGDLWRACEYPDLAIPDAGDLYLALDLSGKHDLSAMAIVAPRDGGGFDAVVRFWTPGDTIQERELRDFVPYVAWRDAGHIDAPAGRSLDYAVPAMAIAELYATGRVVALAFDPYRMEDLARELDELGVPYRYWEGTQKPARGAAEGILLVRHGQGFGGGAADASLWMPRSIGALEDAVLFAGGLRVRENPVLRWNSASAVLAMDAQGNKKWEKRKSTGRIDGIVALSMGVGLAASGDVIATPAGPGWLC